MFNQDEQRKDPRHLPALNLRPSLNLIDAGRVSTLNARCLELIAHLARSHHSPMPMAVCENRALWCDLDPVARQRAAESSLLLLDLRFADAEWWRVTAHRKGVDAAASTASYLPPIMASELARETLTLGWMLARADSGVATIVCGMSTPVAQLFASFAPLDVERLCALHPHLQLRFDDHPAYWRMLLKSAGCKRVSVRSRSAPNEDPQQSLF